MENYINKLELEYKKFQNTEYALSQSAYMRNMFAYFGLKSEKRREISKTFLKENGKPKQENLLELIKLLWQKPQRDFQYFALDLLEKQATKFREEDLQVIEYMIIEKSWWDTVDLIAAKLAGKYFKKFPEKTIPTTHKWMASGNIWLQRSALLFQLKYKKNTDTALLFSYITALKDSKEFFIRKAIGWILREYSKTNAQQVIDFVNQTKLSVLSEKEALKWLNNNKMKANYLNSK